MVTRLFLTIIIFILFSPLSADAFTSPDKFVRTANYYLKAGPDIPLADFEKLARYDLLILPMEAQSANRDFFVAARSLNPDIIILAYLPTRSVNPINMEDGIGLRKKIVQAADQGDWYLRNTRGEKISAWFGTWAINATTAWQNFLPEFVSENIKNAGQFDGVFYDEVDPAGISWLNQGDIDLDRNGQKDAPALADAHWRQSLAALFRKTRELVGRDWLIMINGSSLPEYQPWINGRLFEDFPAAWENGGQWAPNMANYSRSFSTNRWPVISAINSATQNTGASGNYQRVRFGLTSALLQNGFFSFDYGTENHGQIWWYDEYDARLGAPLDRAKLMSDSSRVLIDTAGVWLRDFERGRSIVNSTNRPVEVRLNGAFDQIHGGQDPIANAGGQVTTLTVPAQDGRVLLRPIGEVRNAPFVNSAFIKVYDSSGRERRAGFFHTERGFSGGTVLLKSDLLPAAGEEIMAAIGNAIEIHSAQGERLVKFFPFSQEYSGGLTFAVCDLNGDKNKKIVAGAGRGGGPQVRLFNLDGTEFRSGFFAYGRGFRGGVNVACADINGDGQDDIITGAGSGGGPHLRVFDADGRLINFGFFAFDKKRRAGVYVAAADLDKDGRAEIIAGEAQGGGTMVKIFNGAGKLLSAFQPFDDKTRSGVPVTAADIDSDGQIEILPMTTELF